jgi:superfamily II DNA or RNA helicase
LASWRFDSVLDSIHGFAFFRPGPVMPEAKQARVELVGDHALGLTFPYDEARVAAVKRLAGRRWNPAHKRWEVHLTHLGAVMRLFGLAEADLPPGLRGRARAQGGGAKQARVELGPLRARLSGGDLPLAELDAAASFPVPGHRFSPRFQNGQWDGRKHLFNTNSLTFPSGLWPRLRRILEKHGLALDVSGQDRGDRRCKPAAGEAIGGSEPATPLRDYQRKALMQALQAGRGVIQMPTGGGKTLLAAYLIHAIGRPTFFFVHTRDLLHQTATVLERELGMEIGLLGDGRAMLRPVTVATVQTAGRALEAVGASRGKAAVAAMAGDEANVDAPPGPVKRRRKPASGDAPALAEDMEDEEEALAEEAPVELDAATLHEIVEAIQKAGLVVFDECHHVPAATFYRVASRAASAAWRFGLSATPWRDDHQDMLLEAALGPVVSVTDFSGLIALGNLVPARILVTRPRMPRLARPRELGYAGLYRLAIVENQERNRAIAARARQWAAQGLSVLVLVAQTAHGRALAALLPEAGFVHGGVDSEQRRRALDELERKLRPILIATTLADEGLDVPSLGAVILAGAGKSATRLYQRIGRALRPAPGKQEALVQDFLDEAPWLRQHGEARLELYRQEACFRIELDNAAAAAEQS